MRLRREDVVRFVLRDVGEWGAEEVFWTCSDTLGSLFALVPTAPVPWLLLKGQQER